MSEPPDPPELPGASLPESDSAAELVYTVSIRSISDSRVAAALASRVAAGGGVNPSAVAIAASELTTNVVNHARDGTLRIYKGPTSVILEAVDRGPGIADVEAAFQDGYSRGRLLGIDDSRREGLGCGLGAVRRLMDRVDVETGPGQGTRIVAVKFRSRKAR